jgi:hypothetical protein
VRKEFDKSWLWAANSSSLGTPDCPVVHQTVSGAPGWSGTRRRLKAKNHRTVRWCTGPSGESFAANSSLSGNGKDDVAIIHRTVRWCTGLSGEPTVTSANGRPCNPWATHGRSNDRQGAPDSVRCANGPELQRSSVPDLEGDHAPDCYRDCPVVHRTVRCTTRQKASLAFQVGLQRLLAALGYKRDP